MLSLEAVSGVQIIPEYSLLYNNYNLFISSDPSTFECYIFTIELAVSSKAFKCSNWRRFNGFYLHLQKKRKRVLPAYNVNLSIMHSSKCLSKQQIFMPGIIKSN